MTISVKGTPGTTVYHQTSVAPAVPTHAVGDMIILFVGTKPDDAPANTPAGWSFLGFAAGGSGTTGADTGPMRVGIFYKIATSTTESPGTISPPGNSVTAAKCVVFQKTNATAVWDIAGVGAADTTTGSPHSVTMPTNPGLTAADYLFAIGVIPTDISTPSQFSAETVSATGMTTVSLTEMEEWDSGTGNDMGGWLAHGPVVTGTATAAPTVSATAGGTTTNVAGPIYLVRLRELVITDKSGTDSGSVSITDSSSTAKTFIRTFNNNAGTTDIGKTAAKGATSTDNSGVDDSLTAITRIAGLGTLADNFDDNSIDTSKWEVVSATVSETGGRLTFSPNISSADIQSTREYYAVPGDSLIVEVPQALVVSGAQAYTGIMWGGIGIDIIDQGTVMMWTGLNNWQATYVPSTHRWFKFEIDSSYNALAYTSSDGFAWTLRATIATHPDDRYGKVYIMASKEGGTSVTTPAAIDNISTQPQGITNNASDSGSISITETATIAVTQLVSDSGSVSVIDSSALILSVSKSASDSGSVSITDTPSNAIVQPVTDTGTLSVTDTSSTAVSSTGTDSGVVSITDATATAVIVSASDSGAVSIADAQNSSSTLSSTDASTISLTENRQTLSTLTRTDSSEVSVSEAVTTSVSINTADSGTVSITDSGDAGGGNSDDDSGTLTITESVQVVVTQSRDDTSVVAISDVGSRVLSGTISNNSGATDVGKQKGDGATATDESGAQDDLSHQIVQGIIPKSGTETVSVSVTETTQNNVATSASDSASVSVSDVSSQTVAVPATDAGSVSITDASSRASVTTRTDTSSVSITDVASVVKKVFVDDDSGTTDAGRIVGRGGVSTDNSGVSDDISTNIIGITIIPFTFNDNAGSTDDGQTTSDDFVVETEDTNPADDTILVRRNNARSDTGNVSITESRSLFVTQFKTASDSGTLSLTESSAFPAQSNKVGAETATVSVAETTQIVVTQTRADAGAVSITDIASAQTTEFVSKSATDTLAVAVTDVGLMEPIVGVVKAATDSLVMTIDEIAIKKRRGRNISFDSKWSYAIMLNRGITTQSRLSNRTEEQSNVQGGTEKTSGVSSGTEPGVKID